MNIFVYGTTAELIKIWPVFSRLDRVEYKLVSTGQQPSDLARLEEALGVSPDFRFRKESAKPLTRLHHVFFWVFQTSIHLIRLLTNPELGRKRGRVVVHGDTMTSTLAALFGFALRYPIAHIEAGLRSGNLLNPFPEEIDRVITARFTRLHFAPGDKAVSNLNNRKGRVINTYFNTVVDALADVPKLEPRDLTIPSEFALICLHRAELLSNKLVLNQTLETISKIARVVHVVMVLDPLTESSLRNQEHYSQILDSEYISIVRKLIYPEFQYLLQNCEFLITDSGGQQEEAAQLGIPCIVHRRATERHEGLGANIVLSYWDQDALVSFANNYKYFRRPTLRLGMSPSKIIVDCLRD